MAQVETLSSQAYRAIRLAMLHGRLEADTLYSEAALAADLGISRTPTREALRQLEAEGLIETLPQRGFRLRTIDDDELAEFFELRLMLESFVVRTLCQRSSPEQIEALRQLLKRQGAVADDTNEFISLDEEFHVTMAEMAGLRRTARTIGSLRGVLWLLGTRVVTAPKRRQSVVAEHLAVVTAIEARDPQQATRAMQRHVHQTARAAAASRVAARDAK